MTARKHSPAAAPVLPTPAPAAPAAPLYVLPSVPAIVSAAVPFLDHGYRITGAGASHVMLTHKHTRAGRALYWLATVLVLTGQAGGTALVPAGVAQRLRLADVGGLMLRYGLARKPHVYLGLDAHGRVYSA